MIYAFVIVCWGFPCPWGLYGYPTNYPSLAQCEDAAIDRIVLEGARYPMRYRALPDGVSDIPDRMFRYLCARG